MRTRSSHELIRAAGRAAFVLALCTLPALGQTDPRVGLRAGWWDAQQAARGMELLGSGKKAEGFYNPSDPGDFGFLNGDLAFKGNIVVQGGFHGFQVWDVSDPHNPRLRSTFVCPGGQGDPTLYRNLLFFSVEETRGRVDCGGGGVQDTVSKERFRGVRIFDVTDFDHPKQVAAVQTCRGSHTHTLVVDPKDTKNVYIYVSGTAGVRSPNELAGCSPLPPEQDKNTSLFRIDVIQVPLDHPQDAKVVSNPRIFADAAGNVAGLWKGGAHGEGTQSTNVTNQCHDITVYSAIGMAAGACSGNGLLLDIRDVVHPKRLDAVADPNFAYWHSATFSNDGKKVLFSDEWGGGSQPKCRATDNPKWGADAIFTIENGKMTQRGYFKIPAPQTDQENCVAHNGSLIPVPGRDILVQGWYQGGLSVFDFTDPSNPKEIAFFDRGPMDSTKLYLSGFWAGYWYNGLIYGDEIGRGLDILELKPSEFLSQNEIDAAKLIHVDLLNVQDQQRYTFPPSFVVPRAYLDQLARNNGLAADRLSAARDALAKAESAKGTAQHTALTQLASTLDADAKSASDAAKVRTLAASVRDLANAKR
jgi:hypothetical protein